MESTKKLYYGDSIKLIHRYRITKQLKNGDDKKMKKNLHPIVMRKSGENLFQLLKVKDYYKLSEVSEDFLLVGVVTSYGEFSEFIENFFNECLGKEVEINKKAILTYLSEVEF